ncbi:hypothetical protein HZC07_01855 [Candidatus Micrarchaeota archaeon]|nr:hypothetical protein [Candidatus Micrarchaeota archaeon]
MNFKDKFDSLVAYREALGQPDQEVFDKLVEYAKNHVAACARANNLSLFESMLLAMVLEQQKKIEQLTSAS